MNNLLSVKQVAFMLRVHPLTIRRYIKEKKLKAIKVGGNVRIQETDLQGFQQEIVPVPSAASVILKVRKYLAKSFSEDDPFLRLQGRGATLILSQEVKK